jgi:Transposase DDE domain group 1
VADCTENDVDGVAGSTLEPEVRIVVRGDSHYGRVEAMEWCEQHGVDYTFGFGGNAVLKAMTQQAADVLCVERAARAAARVSGTLCKEVSVSLPRTGDSHDDQFYDYARTAGSTAC